MTGQSEQRLEVEESLREIEDTNEYEYKVKLIDTKHNEVLDEFDSLSECHRPDLESHLTEANARSTIKKIKEDVAEGDADAWFDYEL